MDIYYEGEKAREARSERGNRERELEREGRSERKKKDGVEIGEEGEHQQREEHGEGGCDRDKLTDRNQSTTKEKGEKKAKERAERRHQAPP